MNKNEKVGAQVNLIKLPTNTRFEFQLDQETDWVKEILMEMNENATEKEPSDYLEETALRIEGFIEKKNKTDLGEFLLVEGTIVADYATECVRTLSPMSVELDIPFKICFIDESLATTEAFQDLDETYVENGIYEIYFYTKRTVDLQAMIHEQIFLHYDQYPILDAESKLIGVDSKEETK